MQKPSALKGVAKAPDERESLEQAKEELEPADESIDSTDWDDADWIDDDADWADDNEYDENDSADTSMITMILPGG